MRRNTPFENFVGILGLISIISFLLAALFIFIIEKNNEKQIIGGFFVYVGVITGSLTLLLANFLP